MTSIVSAFPGGGEISASAARREAQTLLRECLHPLGFAASAAAGPASRRVEALAGFWGCLGALSCEPGPADAAAEAGGADSLVAGVRSTLATLAAYQSPKGRVPDAVEPSPEGDPTAAEPRFFDSNSWLLLGLYFYLRTRENIDQHLDFLKMAMPSVEASMEWLAARDSAEAGLIDHGQGGLFGWKLSPARGWSLGANALACGAYQGAAWIARAAEREDLAVEWSRMADRAARLIREYFWLGRDAENVSSRAEESDYHRERNEPLPPAALREARELARLSGGGLPFFASHIDPLGEAGLECDAAGNLLALLFGVADEEQADALLRHLEGCMLPGGLPARALYPPASLGSPSWNSRLARDADSQPWRGHNGGVVLWVGALWALVLELRAERRESALETLEGLARAAALRNSKSGGVSKLGEGEASAWGFCGWLHGETGSPLGPARRLESAGSLLVAAETISGELGPRRERLRAAWMGLSGTRIRPRRATWRATPSL
jgi:hypothetical protein